jgi:enolase
VEAVEVILKHRKGRVQGRRTVAIALDPAASELYDEETHKYNLRKEGRMLSSEEMSPSGRTGSTSTHQCRSKTALPRTTGTAGDVHRRSRRRLQIVATTSGTNPERVRRGIRENACNALLVK